MSKKFGANRRRVLQWSLGAASTSIAGFPLVAWAADQKWKAKYDVAVIGGGNSGLCAALEAAHSGKKVLVVQAQPILGGNSALSTGWFTCVNSPVQLKLSQIKDSPEQFYKDSMAISGGLRDPVWTRIVAENSGADIAWLQEQGVEFENIVEASMGSTIPRAIQAKGYGGAVVRAIAKRLEETKKADVLVEARCRDLITRSNRIAGISVQTATGKDNYACNSVVLASGGWVHNKELVARYLRPEYRNLEALGVPQNVGDGLLMALKAGAATQHMDQVLVVPTTDKATRIYLTSGALAGGGILVNEKGERFTNELEGYTQTSLAMLKQKVVYEIVVPECHTKVQDLIDKDMIQRADSVADLAKKINVPEGNLQKEIDAHNAATRGEIKDRFGRTIYKNQLRAPFYFLSVMPTSLISLGGVRINDKAAVVNDKGKPALPGLYAVGEVASGYRDGGYRTGDSMMFCVVSGRIAGKQASLVD